MPGVVRKNQVILNPGRRRLQGSETGIVIGTSQKAVDLAMRQAFTVAPPLIDAEGISGGEVAASPRSMIADYIEVISEAFCLSIDTLASVLTLNK